MISFMSPCSLITQDTSLQNDTTHVPGLTAMLKGLSGFPAFYGPAEMKLWLAFNFKVLMLDFRTIILLECFGSEFLKNKKLRKPVKERQFIHRILLFFFFRSLCQNYEFSPLLKQVCII